ncbi:MAG: TIM barrel protein [Gemmataceae bacterium]|nr:TIM barrel protein [Gemmataceae bacterium]
MHPSRRDAFAAAAIVAAATTSASHAESSSNSGKLSQSVCRWCYGKTTLEKLAEQSKAMGYRSVELLNPKEAETVHGLGMTCAVLHMGGPITIPNGLNRPDNHEKILKTLSEGIDIAARMGIPNVICFSGNRKGLDDAQGLANCARGLKQVTGQAESKQVTIIMELLNSKVDHKDYMADRTAWGADLVQAVGSPRFKLLYDIYHMQIMEGDVIRTLTQHKESIGHYHTGGVPGRAEIDSSQELNYPAICRAIMKTGFNGYLGQEFIPRKDPMTSLADAFKICDV